MTHFSPNTLNKFSVQKGIYCSGAEHYFDINIHNPFNLNQNNFAHVEKYNKKKLRKYYLIPQYFCVLKDGKNKSIDPQMPSKRGNLKRGRFHSFHKLKDNEHYSNSQSSFQFNSSPSANQSENNFLNLKWTPMDLSHEANHRGVDTRLDFQLFGLNGFGTSTVLVVVVFLVFGSVYTWFVAKSIDDRLQIFMVFFTAKARVSVCSLHFFLLLCICIRGIETQWSTNEKESSCEVSAKMNDGKNIDTNNKNSASDNDNTQNANKDKNKENEGKPRTPKETNRTEEKSDKFEKQPNDNEIESDSTLAFEKEKEKEKEKDELQKVDLKKKSGQIKNKKKSPMKKLTSKDEYENDNTNGKDKHVQMANENGNTKQKQGKKDQKKRKKPCPLQKNWSANPQNEDNSNRDQDKEKYKEKEETVIKDVIQTDMRSSVGSQRKRHHKKRENKSMILTSSDETDKDKDKQQTRDNSDVCNNRRNSSNATNKRSKIRIRQSTTTIHTNHRRVLSLDGIDNTTHSVHMSPLSVHCVSVRNTLQTLTVSTLQSSQTPNTNELGEEQLSQKMDETCSVHSISNLQIDIHGNSVVSALNLSSFQKKINDEFERSTKASNSKQNEARQH
ncbi:PHD zinc finger-containing protein [Reticulomyxa filosa]|uniref:PHD zinc finger-containing protein n=1 Tax=Reticulomyxa filosa TaxID=46433 RepID=X6NUJ5_RETFI|nr:PHD zinc finger-containing protein [Reticulomyxa filosa]|eukprot:ETO28922.1 PHD zinc finger-containing protein [Reticulomyxa filosa]